MKKVYSMMALALAVGLGASAAPTSDVKKSQPVDAQAIVSVEPIGTGVAFTTPAKSNAPAKVISNTKELEGMKKWTGTLMFGQKELNGTVINGPQAGVAFVEDARDTRITIANFPTTGLNLRLQVDMDKKEVSFDSGVYVGDVNTNTGVKECNIYVHKINGDIVLDETDGLYKYTERTTECETAVGKILDDGSISFEGYTMLAQSPDMVAGGSVYLMLNTANIVFQTTPWNTPVESEYTYVGTGEYKDPFFAPMWKDPSIVPVNKKAEIYTKKEGGNVLIAVKNPYKDLEGTATIEGQTYDFTDFWKETGVMYEDATEDGWLLFEVFQNDKFKNFQNPVACIPMVQSGMEMDVSPEEDGSDVQMYYPFNTEGEAWYNGGEDNLLDLLESWDILGTEYSSVDTTADGDVISIRNEYCGRGKSPLTGYWWVGNNNVAVERMVGTVKLPAGTLGIQGVATDMVDGPAKYYNLQGVEVAAPVKGQLVIKTQGGKSTKFIAR